MKPPPYAPAPRLTDEEYRALEVRAAAYAARTGALDEAELAANRGGPGPDDEVVWADDPARTERPEADRYEESEACRFAR